MGIVELRDRERLAAFLARRPALHAYELGDLDDFFWPHTRWFGLDDHGVLHQVALLYEEHDPPTLIAMARPPEGGMAELLAKLAPGLPDRFECHAGPEALAGLGEAFEPVRGPHAHVRMALEDDAAAQALAEPVEVLGGDDLDEVTALYAAAYPSSWFHERRLETGRYVGLREHGRLVCVAGVHVHAPAFGVAALGDVATHPTARGRGKAAATCAGLCALLREDGCTTIALNVREDNIPAIAAYRRIGFDVVTGYLETTLVRRTA